MWQSATGTASFPRLWGDLQVAEQDTAGGLPAGAQVTMGFNRARLLEAAGNLQAAAREYEGILQVRPVAVLLGGRVCPSVCSERGGLVPLAHVTVSAVSEVVSLLTCKCGATKAVLQCVHQAASMWGSGLCAGVPGVH